MRKDRPPCKENMRTRKASAVRAAVLPFLFILLLCACGTARAPARENGAPAYRQMTQEEAVRLMETESGYCIVDVRRADEFASGHIPGAINVPNEEIGQEAPEALPDKAQLLLVFCRSGNRSKQASEKLAALGYTNVVEFGGILDWKGEIVTGAETGG